MARETKPQWVASTVTLAVLTAGSLRLVWVRGLSEWPTVALLGLSAFVALVVLVGPSSIRLGAAGSEFEIRRERERIDSSLERLQEIVLALARVSSFSVAWTMRFTDESLPQRMTERAKEIRAALVAAGIPKEQQDETYEIIARFVRHDLVADVVTCIREVAEEETEGERRKWLKALSGQIHDNYRWIATVAEADEMVQRIRAEGLLSHQSIAAGVERVRHFVSTGEVLPLVRKGK